MEFGKMNHFITGFFASGSSLYFKDSAVVLYVTGVHSISLVYSILHKYYTIYLFLLLVDICVVKFGAFGSFYKQQSYEYSCTCLLVHMSWVYSGVLPKE